jgi:hypothetical protein
MATIRLLPQTINGTVSTITSSSSFTTYTIMLAAYDLFPDFAAQPGQTSLLTNPNTVVVYVDSNTQQLNSDQYLFSVLIPPQERHLLQFRPALI